MSARFAPARALALSLLCCPWSCGAAPARSAGSAGASAAATSAPSIGVAASGAVTAALRAELDRTMKQLRFQDYEAPYFVGFRLIEHRDVEVAGRFGAVTRSRDTRGRSVAVDVRVGDYTFDSAPE